ncbi:MAG: hypothetical protein AB1304_08695 [Bacteroidota bacterium]
MASQQLITAFNNLYKQWKSIDFTNLYRDNLGTQSLTSVKPIIENISKRLDKLNSSKNISSIISNNLLSSINQFLVNAINQINGFINLPDIQFIAQKNQIIQTLNSIHEQFNNIWPSVFALIYETQIDDIERIERINSLLNKMLSQPLNFNNEDFNQLIESYKIDGQYNVDEAFKDFRECMKRVYKINEENLKETSNANSGVLGFLNRRSTRLRKKEFLKRVNNQDPNKKYIMIYAEGDSWYLFPIFVTDIIDWLEKNDNYLIYSDAYGGDWITNIIYEGQYIEELTKLSPNVFLISGGGNDLVGHERLAVMVSRTNNQLQKYNNQSTFKLPISDKEKQLIFKAQPYFNKEFYAFIWILKAQYTMLFNGIYLNTDNFKDMITITHGYAYPFPKKGVNFSFKRILQPLINKVLGSGKWLYTPLMMKGITDPELQRAIVTTFIYEFNVMHYEISQKFENVFYVDCRNIAKNQSDWYDELHLNDNKYKEIADCIKNIIDTKYKINGNGNG